MSAISPPNNHALDQLTTSAPSGYGLWNLSSIRFDRSL